MDGTGISWVVENTPGQVLDFILVVLFVFVSYKIYRHEKECNEIKKEMFIELRNLKSELSKMVGYIKGKESHGDS